MFTYTGWCAGIRVKGGDVPNETALRALLKTLKEELDDGSLTITCCNGSCMQVASEICIDVYEVSPQQYRADLSTAFKR